MSRSFEVLARTQTLIGEIVLRRRLEPTIQRDIFEVMLDGDGLMSSLFTHGEEQLAQLGLAAVAADEIDVAVGGLGLGFTARAVLQDAGVRSLYVIEMLDVVIDWHRRGLVPLGPELTGDPRCTLIHGDFFARVQQKPPLTSGSGPTQFDAILLDIDHSPRHLLDARHAPFYQESGLRQLGRHLRPGGVFALWSNDPPDNEFLAALRTSFTTAAGHIVKFWNFLIDDESQSTIYVARSPLN